MNSKDFSFVFICQAGDLEIKSLLLAISLKKYLSGNSEIVVVIPEINGKVIQPSDFTMDTFRKLEIRIEKINNRFIRSSMPVVKGDIFSNKIFCFEIDFEGEIIVFLDSDMLSMKPLEFNITFRDYEFLAKQADSSNVRKWDEIYRVFNIKKPAELIPCTFDKFLLPPYFNAGLIAVKRSVVKQFSTTWLEVFIRISREDVSAMNFFNPHYRDQISLAVTVEMLKLKKIIIGEEYNYPIKLRKFNKNGLPYFAHYHNPLTIFRNRKLREIVGAFCNEYPGIIELIRENEGWNKIFFGSFFSREAKYFKSRIRRIKNGLRRKFLD